MSGKSFIFDHVIVDIFLPQLTRIKRWRHGYEPERLSHIVSLDDVFIYSGMYPNFPLKCVVNFLRL